jgi:uroporphyrin-III C-methyltransferase
LAESGALEAASELLLKKLERTLFYADADLDSDGAFNGAKAESEAEAGNALVSLVGAGPGDPDLLTLRAAKRVQAADVVVHDRLVSPEVLALARPDAECIDVGKAPGGQGCTQPQINALLIRLGRQGKRVVRLKGGDPYVFGRGGEEALALATAGVLFEVVPGVSSALAGPAAAGIPVTHRGLSGSVTIANGHDTDQHEWSALARSRGTLVFLMAVEHLEHIVDNLLVHGRSADEPAALVEWATTPRQRVVTGGLSEIAGAARCAKVEAPAVLVVGPTAALAGRLTAAPKHGEERRALLAAAIGGLSGVDDRSVLTPGAVLAAT